MTQALPTDSSDRELANQRNLRRLVVSVQASLHKLNLLIAICDNPFYRDELIRTYETELIAKGVSCHQIQLDRQHPSLKQSLLDWQASLSEEQRNRPTLVTVRGGDELLGIRLEQPKSAQERFFFSVQWTREGLREFQFPVVLWVTQTVAQGLAQQAPDFWSWRGGVFEFEQPITWQAPDQSQELDRQPTTNDEPLADPTELEQQIADLKAEDPNSPLLASLYHSLGATYYDRLKQGKATDRPQETEKAIAAFQAAIALRESLPDLTPLAKSLGYLALLYKSQGRYGEAEPLYLQSLAIYEQQLGGDHPNVATSLNNLAGLYQSQGRYSEAEPLLVRSLAIKEQQLGSDHLSVATNLNNLAELYRAQGRYTEAEHLRLRCLEIERQTLGENHPQFATSLNNLASLYQDQGRYSEAEPLYVRSLAIKEQQLGKEHPTVSTSLNNLAGLHQSQGRYSEAEPLFVRSLSIYEQQLGSSHPLVATNLNNLAVLYRVQGRYSEAEPLYVRSLQIKEKVLGENHPSTKLGWENFWLFVQQVVMAGREGELSDHPMTQAVLKEIMERRD